MLSALQAERERRLTEDRLRYYSPYPKQAEFHAAGATHRERLLMAGNQIGKTLAGGFEAAIHATGRYPDGWKGKRFDRPTNGWLIDRQTAGPSVSRAKLYAIQCSVFWLDDLAVLAPALSLKMQSVNW